MRTLIVDDDFVSRRMLQRILQPYGECEIAVDGSEAVFAFEEALKEGDGYNLICLDISMPVLSGVEALTQIRKIEEKAGIGGLQGVKVIMTTASDDSQSIFGAFNAGCESYIVKPVNKEQLLAKLSELGFELK